AIRLCGLLTDGEEPSADQIAQATFHLNLALQELQAADLVLTTVSRATLALIAGTAEYDLPSDVIDVELGQDDAIGSIVNASGVVETIVKTMSRAEWMNIAVKDVAGRPSRAYIEKKALTRVVFWPVPDSSVSTFRYSSVTFLRGADTGLVTMQTRRTWTSYLMYATASGVAFDNSMTEKGTMFMGIANGKLEKCKAGDAQHGRIRLGVGRSARNW
ncbi:MAG TPA: hypothetical protein VIV60_06005, partial [Polyangiaceae bacterium]